MKHIYPSLNGLCHLPGNISRRTRTGPASAERRVRDWSWRPPQEVGGGFGNFPGGQRGRGSSARSGSCRPPRGCVDSARSPCWSVRGQAAWPGGRDPTHAVADSVEHALGNESAFPRSPPCRNTHSATRGLRCRPVSRARAAPPSAPMGTRPVVPCQTTVQFEVRAITILGSPYMSDYFLLHFGFTATE